MLSECEHPGSGEGLTAFHTPVEVAEVFRRYGFGEFFFRKKLSGEKVDELRLLLPKARRIEPCLMGPEGYLAQMWGEFQIGDLDRSLENADKVLNLSKEGSPQFLTALSCKVYLQVRLGQFNEAIQSMTKHQGQLEMSASKRTKGPFSVLGRRSTVLASI